jgi:hypothetical protein
LSHTGHFGDKAAHEQAAKVAKIKGGSTPGKPSASKPPIGNALRAPPASKGTNIASGSNPSPTDQKVDNKLKGTMGIEDKEVVVDPRNPDKKLRINDNLDLKKDFALIIFLWDNLDVFAWKISDMPGIPRDVIEHKSDRKSISYLKLGSSG